MNTKQNGKYLVLFEKHKQLYVEVKDEVVLVDNPFDFIPTKVDLNKVDGKYYVAGYEPKPKAVSANTKKKNNKKED